MKKEIGQTLALYPTPLTLVGTMTEGKPNWALVGHVGIIGHDRILVSMAEAHFTNKGIKETGVLSVSLIDENFLPQADRAGCVSGHRTDKSGFFPWHAAKNGAPFPEGAPVSMACTVVDTYRTPGFESFICRIDETAAEAMGINLFRHKELSFVISSFFAGISGALLAMFQYTVQAQQFKSMMTYEILLIVVIGGIGSISGSCIASFLYITLSEWWLRGLDMGSFLGIDAPNLFRSGFRKLVFSIIIMIIVLFFSRGIMGDKELSLARIKNFFQKARTKKSRKEAKA